MRTKKNSACSLEELDLRIEVLVTRKVRMENQIFILQQGLDALNRRLQSLYSNRTIALNFTLPLEDVTK
jgi:hypothetical protein